MAYRRTVISSFLRAVSVTSAIGLAFLLVAQFSRLLLFNCSRCSFLMATRPEWFPDKLRAGTSVPPSNYFSGGWGSDVFSFVSEGAFKSTQWEKPEDDNSNCHRCVNAKLQMMLSFIFLSRLAEVVISLPTECQYIYNILSQSRDHHNLPYVPSLLSKHQLTNPYFCLLLEFLFWH